MIWERMGSSSTAATVVARYWFSFPAIERDFIIRSPYMVMKATDDDDEEEEDEE